MTDLYRRLLSDLAERFGGTIDEANADAIAYAAAELYHRDFEPRLWQERSAHDLLDLFGIPRAGVFAPYSLSDRLILFQRRSSQAEYVAKAHELLNSLDVPRQDQDGHDMSLKWRLDQIVASANGAPEAQPGAADTASQNAASEAAAPAAAAAAAKEDPVAPVTKSGENQVDDYGLVEGTSPDEELATPGADEELATPGADDGKVEPGGEGKAKVAAGGEGKSQAGDEDKGQDDKIEARGTEVDDDGTTAERDEADGAKDEDGAPFPEPAATAAIADGSIADGSIADGSIASNDDRAAPDDQGSESSDAASGSALSEPSPARLVDAVLALEQAARVEEELATTSASPGGVDVIRLTETLNGIQGEIAALRELVEAFEIGMRRQLDELQAQMAAAAQSRQAASPSPGSPDGSGPVTPPAPMTAPNRPFDPTRLMSPLPETLDETGEGESGLTERRSLRRVLLFVLLLALGLLLAGGIVLLATVGWDSLSSQLVGLLLPHL